ncbi:MAG: hypothetical protein ABII82_03880 [Verrucomicrobiota bacterium]
MKLPSILVALLGAVAAQAQTTTFSTTVTTSKGEAVADAVVFLTAATPPATAPTAPSTPVVIAQSGQEYQPFVTPILVGTSVEFPNRDNVQHHLYSVSPPKRFEKPLYASGSSEVVLFDKPGVVVLGCNIHDWMSAYVLVLETPHFALTDAEGKAVVDNLPPGTYRAEVWHPRIRKNAARDVAIDNNPRSETFAIDLRPDRRFRRAPVSDGPVY